MAQLLLAELKKRIAFLERNLVRSRLATEQDVRTVADRFKGARSKDKLWEQWAELRALALARALSHEPEREFSRESLEAAVAALGDQTQEVTLRSVGETFTIHPASFLRIKKIEKHAMWVAQLDAASSVVLTGVVTGEKHSASPEVCETCERPLAPGQDDELLARIQTEMEYQRSMLYANVVAPGPQPVEEPVDWSGAVTQMEETILMQVYHQVTYDVLAQLPSPKSKDGERELPKSWAFLFANHADREHRPSVEGMRDRSLGSIVAVMVLQAIRDQKIHAKGKVDASEVKEAAASG